MADAGVASAMILAAGEGTRLRPLTLETPKALLPIAGTPLLEYTLTWLRSYGVEGVVINLHYLGERIREHLGDGSRLGVRIGYSEEETLLGTAGAVKKAERLLADRFFLVYGDVLTDCDLSALLRFHVENGAAATLALSPVSNPSEAGIVQIDSGGRVLSFIEKPPRGQEVGNLANGGIYVLERSVLQFVEIDRYCDFGFHVFPRLLREGLPVFGFAIPASTYLLDIGSPAKLRRATENVGAGRIRLSGASDATGPA